MVVDIVGLLTSFSRAFLCGVCLFSWCLTLCASEQAPGDSGDAVTGGKKERFCWTQMKSDLDTHQLHATDEGQGAPATTAPHGVLLLHNHHLSGDPRGEDNSGAKNSSDPAEIQRGGVWCQAGLQPRERCYPAGSSQETGAALALARAQGIKALMYFIQLEQVKQTDSTEWTPIFPIVIKLCPYKTALSSLGSLKRDILFHCGLFPDTSMC